MRGFYDVTLFDCPPFRMFDNDDDPRAADILNAKRFEPQSMRLWCRLVKHASCILDVGAHTGVYSLTSAALRSDVTIHAFEANPYAAARLRVNKHLNGFANIRDHYVAVTDQNGATLLRWVQRPGGVIPSGSSLQEHQSSLLETAVIRMATLDSLVPDPGKLPLIKVDVEEAELLVFRGMPQILRHRPIVLLETFTNSHATAITGLVDNYLFYRIDEDRGPEEIPALTKMSIDSGSFNQLLIPREHAALLPL